jgi:hypothetical protein
MDMPRCEQRASEVMICIFSGMGGFLLVVEPASLAINVRVLLCGVWVRGVCGGGVSNEACVDEREGVGVLGVRALEACISGRRLLAGV